MSRRRCGPRSRAFFDKECSTERVRAGRAARLGPGLWDQLQRAPARGMGVAAGAAATVPVSSSSRSSPRRRVATRAGAARREHGRGAAARGDRRRSRAGPHSIAILAGEVATHRRRATAPGPQLVPREPSPRSSSGCATTSLVLLVDGDRPHAVENLASAPLAWIDLADGVELLSGATARAEFAEAKDEWRTLTAAALVGLGDAAERLGVQYAKDRRRVRCAHRLVSGDRAPVGRRRDRHRGRAPARAPGGVVRRSRTRRARRSSLDCVRARQPDAAEQAGTVAIHTQGGFGFTLESDVQLFFRRAKGWPLVLGDRRIELRRIGAHTSRRPAGRSLS